ncbi:MAG: hypothetical protein QOD55_318 [Solirubrobacteraceae bacterium]|nr:hypothetical protein [Solirubrobacteraceae bacterium]
MRHDTFVTTVGEVAGISRERAERAVEATLRTLSERITGGEVRQLRVLLPREMRPLLPVVPEEAERFGLDEFLRRVAEREGVDRPAAAEHARAVFVALGMAVAPGELKDVARQLPKEFDVLLDAAGVGRGRAMADDELVLRLVVVAGLDRDQARRAVEAVLETLAERISDGEVEDLAAELPAKLRPALERGLRHSRAATPMSVDEFLTRVAEREGVSRDEAEQHTRAVFTTLREFVSGREFSDMAAQLSRDYAALLAAAP